MDYLVHQLSGRQYDGLGNVNLWWNDQTIANFEAKAQCYIDQYNNYYLPELGSDVHVRLLNDMFKMIVIGRTVFQGQW